MRRIAEAVWEEKEIAPRRKLDNYAEDKFNERIKAQIESMFDDVLDELIIHRRERVPSPTVVASAPVATNSRGKRQHPSTWVVYNHLHTWKKCRILKRGI